MLFGVPYRVPYRVSCSVSCYVSCVLSAPPAWRWGGALRCRRWIAGGGRGRARRCAAGGTGRGVSDGPAESTDSRAAEGFRGARVVACKCSDQATNRRQQIQAGDAGSRYRRPCKPTAGLRRGEAACSEADSDASPVGEAAVALEGVLAAHAEALVLTVLRAGWRRRRRVRQVAEAGWVGTGAGTEREGATIQRHQRHAHTDAEGGTQTQRGVQRRRGAYRGVQGCAPDHELAVELRRVDRAVYR